VFLKSITMASAVSEACWWGADISGSCSGWAEADKAAQQNTHEIHPRNGW
jgi:hypothetical protein